MVVPGENSWQKRRASWMDPKRSGYPGRYFIVLRCASENGLSSETCGRLWVFTTPRSTLRAVVAPNSSRPAPLGNDPVQYTGDAPTGKVGSLRSALTPVLRRGLNAGQEGEATL